MQWSVVQIGNEVNSNSVEVYLVAQLPLASYRLQRSRVYAELPVVAEAVCYAKD